MTNEVINLETVFSGFDSGTDLQPKNTRTNNQGVKIEDIAGFCKILATAPATSTLIKGDTFLALDTLELTVCTVTATTVVSVTLTA
tara:strand:+ start:1266 stop:1523 length:258 start_codon:yes stop_codon:yes gene_type:complete